MSVNDEGDQFSFTMPGEESGEAAASVPGDGGWVTAAMMLREDGRVPAALLRAEQPAGAVFALGWVILRRFWPLVVIGLATLGGLLYLVISNLSGASQVWASLVTVAARSDSGLACAADVSRRTRAPSPAE